MIRHDDPSHVISASRIRVGSDSAVIGLPRLDPPHTEPKPKPKEPTEPVIHLVRDGDVIKSIEVTCTCGERIVINCVY